MPLRLAEHRRILEWLNGLTVVVALVSYFLPWYVVEGAYSPFVPGDYSAYPVTQTSNGLAHDGSWICPVMLGFLLINALPLAARPHAARLALQLVLSLTVLAYENLTNLFEGWFQRITYLPARRVFTGATWAIALFAFAYTLERVVELVRARRARA